MKPNDMTSSRALYFMERFKREEKLLGPNEQAAVDYVIAMLAAQPARPPIEAERKAAEHEYITTAFDYPSNPVGSRNWVLYWAGWLARSTSELAAQPAPQQEDFGLSMSMFANRQAYEDEKNKRIRARVEAQPVAQQEYGYENCNNTLRAEGKPYPRTCQSCGITSPCRFPRKDESATPKAQPAPQQEPLGKCCYGGLKPQADCGDCAAWSAQPVAQPVAWRYETKDGIALKLRQHDYFFEDGKGGYIKGTPLYAAPQAVNQMLLEVLKRIRQWDALDIPDTDGAFWKRELDKAVGAAQKEQP